MPLNPLKQPRVVGPDAFIPLGNGREAVIEKEDLPLVQTRNWHILVSPTSTYAVSSAKDHLGVWRKLYLHRLLLITPSSLDVDHIDGDRLNCRLSNLRPATRTQNLGNMRISKRNKSGFKGVSLAKGRLWRAEIYIDRKCKYLGAFATPELAHEAYKAAAREKYGEFFNPG